MYISSDEQTGRFTFEAEGSTDPASRYYYGRLSHPSAQSGVTIGAGYDMGGRNAVTVQSELTAAGMMPDVAATISQGAGLTGAAAEQFVTTNAALRVDNMQIFRNLFAVDFPRYVTRARASFEYHSNTFATGMISYGHAGAVQFTWDTLYPAIRVIAIDLVYQGFGKMVAGYGKPIHFCIANNFDWLINYINATPGLSQYEAGRRRVPYLRARKDFEVLNYSNCIPGTAMAG
jgi:hypothetical protein